MIGLDDIEYVDLGDGPYLEIWMVKKPADGDIYQVVEEEWQNTDGIIPLRIIRDWKRK